MTETMITFNNAMLIGAICLTSGTIIGAALVVMAQEIFAPEPEPRIDWDKFQREMDDEFGTEAPKVR